MLIREDISLRTHSWLCENACLTTKLAKKYGDRAISVNTEKIFEYNDDLSIGGLSKMTYKDAVLVYCEKIRMNQSGDLLNYGRPFKLCTSQNSVYY